MPHDTATALGVFANVESFLVFLVFIVPGFISLRTYDAARGGEARKINEAIVDVIIYSFATDIVWIPLWSAIVALPDSRTRAIAMIAGGILGFVITPMTFALGWYAWQTQLAKRGVIADPVAKPWDKFFTAIAREKLDLGLVLTLPDGRKLGGRYTAPGYASHAPADEQLHVGETWVVDQQTGAFIAPVTGSKGFIVDKKDLISVEFIEWSAIKLPANVGGPGT